MRIPLNLDWPIFVIIVDVRSGHRFEYGRWSESIIHIWQRSRQALRYVHVSKFIRNCCFLPFVCQWFSPGTPVSSTNKTDHHDIAEILLKVVLNTITLPHMCLSNYCCYYHIGCCRLFRICEEHGGGECEIEEHHIPGDLTQQQLIWHLHLEPREIFTILINHCVINLMDLSIVIKKTRYFIRMTKNRPITKQIQTYDIL